MTTLVTDTATTTPDAAPAAFIAAAMDLLGPRGFTTDPDVIGPWLTDWRGRYTGRALGLATPATTAEVASVVQLCARHGVPIVPQGGNSGMCGGATPDDSGHALLINMRRMDAIRRIDATGRQVECEAGVILQTLHEAVERQGLRFPLTLGGKGSATVGGLISTNAGGTQVLRHGSMRAQVLGLEAVLADGSVFNQLVPLKKDNRGFDLKQVFIGSEGTLGIITAATLALEPAVAARAVLWAGVPTVQAARALLLHAQDQAGPALEGFEVIPAHALHAVLDYLPTARAPLEGDHAWHVLIELVADAAAADALPALAETLLVSAFEAGLVADATIAANEAQAEAFWWLRDSVAPAERAKGAAMQHDISVPVDRMADFIDYAAPLMEREFPGTSAVGFGHLGDGNIHFHILAPAGVDGEAWSATAGKAISRRVHDLVTEWGGSISAEHGIGQLKRDELDRLGDPAAMHMLRAVKAALDPRGLLNPGKLV
ncbi:FAD-binding oxidoreductase [Novosphingobium sp.]|uniref:FAD-binding oxidoreductase n=1 Tax=Novosphingobium sp. TaxID=1874826 RepID=UPI00333E9CF4